jgi:outer membrane protein
MILSLLLAAATTKAPTLTLEQALANARAHQPQLRQAQAQVRAAKARTESARATMRPQVSGSAGYQIGNSRVSLDNPNAPANVGNYTASANVSQLLWDFGQAGNRVRAAEATATAQADNAQQTALDVAQNVRTVFFTARANLSLVHVAQETLANQQRHYQQINGLVQVGTRAPIDRAQAAKDVANAKLQLIKAQAAYETSKAQLDQAMGAPGPSGYDVADEAMPAIPGEDQPLDKLVEEAASHRPDLAALDQQLQAQRYTIAATEQNQTPTVRATGGVGSTGAPTQSMNNTVSAGLSLGWPIWSGGAQQAQVEEARANLESLQAQVDGERQALRLEVEQARLAVASEKAAVVAAKETTKNAREQLRLAEGRYAAGVGSVIELADAQLAYTSAQAQEVQEGYRLATARAQLLKALGRP